MVVMKYGQDFINENIFDREESFEDLKSYGIEEAWDGGDFYYLVTKSKFYTDEGVFWQVEKKTGKVKGGHYVTSFVCDDLFSRISPPFENKLIVNTES